MTPTLVVVLTHGCPQVVGTGVDGKGDYRGRCKLIAHVNRLPKVIQGFNGTATSRMMPMDA